MPYEPCRPCSPCAPLRHRPTPLLRVVVDNSKKSSAVTCPPVALRIRCIGDLEGVRAPVRQRVTADLSTPISSAKSASVICFHERYSANLMGTMCHNGKPLTRAKSAKAALAAALGLRHIQGMETRPNRIREWREARGLTLQELAAAINCHHTYLGRIEKGERRLTDSMIAKVSKALKVPAGDIIKAENEIATEQAVSRMAGLLKTMTPDEQEMILSLAETVLSRRAKHAS